MQRFKIYFYIRLKLSWSAQFKYLPMSMGSNAHAESQFEEKDIPSKYFPCCFGCEGGKD
jgi:hypothetical protein